MGTPTVIRNIRYRVEHVLLRTAAWAVPKLPLGLVRAGASVLGTLGWLCDRRGRRAGMENLRCALRLPAGERRRVLRACYRRFACSYAELFWSPRLSPENWDRRFMLQCDTEEARAAFDAGRCVFATAHFGNFEWLSAGKALRGSASMILAQDFKNPPLTALFTHLRATGGRQSIIPREGAMLRLFKHLRKGGSAAALVDLNVKPDQSATIIRCFGLETSVTVLAAALAARTGVPVVPALAVPAADGRWTLRFFAPIPVSDHDDIRTVTQRCWDVFEPVIRAHPECWMWMYKHWRYLPEDARPEEYPAYANRSRKYDRLRQRTFVAAPERGA